MRTTEDVHRWACMEASKALLFEYVPAGKHLSTLFVETIVESTLDNVTTHHGGRLWFGVRHDLPNWSAASDVANTAAYHQHLQEVRYLDGRERRPA